MLLDLSKPEEAGNPSQGKSLDELVADYERNLLKMALDRYKSSSKVAEFFQVDRSTIFRKAKKYKLL
ncbi:MAG: hypothetical protein AAGU16_09880, partial [Desulfitobacterium hafniense]